MISTLTCLAVAVYFEARSEPIEGQMMVAETILNRVEDKRWPDSVCEVVKQPHQFSFYSDGLSDTPTDMRAYATATEVAQEALNGNHLDTNALWYHATYVSPSWRLRLQPIGVVGGHIFYIDQ